MIITSKHYIIGAVILLLALKVIFKNDAEEDTPTIADTQTVEVVAWSPQKEAEFEATQRRIAHLEELEEYQEKRAISAKALPHYRDRILASRKAEWTAILEKHWAEYEALLKVAEQSASGMALCTICKGDTYLDFCIFCEEPSNGVCATCSGEGIQFGDEICPTCNGSGKCFMCTHDKHQMMCPFCDDGMIIADGPAPSEVPTTR